MIASLLQALREPEYVHVLINPIPVYGLLIAIIGLAIALVQRSRRAQIATLILIALCAISVWPVVHYGEAGYDRALALSDDQGQAWLKVHEHRADEFAWCYYVLGVIALLAIFLPRKWPKAATLLALVTLLCSLGVLALGGYIAYAGGRIRHREFRTELAPPVPAETDDH
ncbi:MAG TPA: hypothetical protein VGG02_04280 [Chthoniobacterales bacterium]|jgi:FtsH-binding integral membrane protein